MSDLWPAPIPGAPYTSRSMASLVLASAAREVSDFSRGMVPTGPRRQPSDGSIVADAVRLRALVDRLLAAAVVAEREDGTPWEEVAEALGLTVSAARSTWDGVVETWLDQLVATAAPGGLGSVSDDLPAALLDPPEEIARELDEWVLHHRDPTDPIEGTAPVTAGLERMHPFLELMRLDARKRGLLASVDPQPAELAPLVEREAAISAALAMDGQSPAGPSRRHRSTRSGLV